MLIPTEQQQEIIKQAKLGRSLAIKAGAGSAKTSTCIMIAEQVPKTSLYLAFNKSIATEASERFPSHVKCQTMHSRAWQTIVKGTSWQKKDRLVGFYSIKDWAGFLQEELQEIPEDSRFGFVEAIKLAVIGFCQSAVTNLDVFLSDFEQGLAETDLSWLLGDIELFCFCVHKIWKEISKPTGVLPTTHDVYLKLFQLSKPNLSKDFGVIYVDEFQDTNPVVADIILQQIGKTQIIAVGDENQSIYAWRGAINAFDLLPKKGFTWLELSESFRFNSNIARQANCILQNLPTEMEIIGRNQSSRLESKAYIVRNNITLINSLLSAADNGQKVFCNADLKDLWKLLYDANILRFTKTGERPNFKFATHPWVSQFRNFKELLLSKDPQAAKINSLLQATQNVSWGEKTGLFAAIEKAKSCLVEEPEFADLTLTTGHKSKGLEWDEIFLSDDFLPAKTEDGEYLIDDFIENQGFQLLYVAVTRAKVRVNASSELLNFINGDF